MFDTANTTAVNRDKNSEVLKLQLKYKIDDNDPMLAFFYLLETETKAIVEQNKKASVLIKDIEFHIPKMENLIQSVQRYETNVRDKIINDLNQKFEVIENKHLENLSSIFNHTTDAKELLRQIIEKENVLKNSIKFIAQDIQNNLDDSVQNVETAFKEYAKKITSQKDSFEKDKSSFYKNMEQNLKASIDKSFFNLRNFMILNSSLTVILFAYVIFK
jgi:hypothetical protein